MPSVQRGSVVKRGRGWAARWYDAEDTRRFKGGFATKSDAREWVDGQVKGVAALRRGDLLRPDQIPTVDVLVVGFLASHEVDPATIEKLTCQLAHARRAFGDRPIDELRPVELSAWRATLPARSRHQPFGAFRQVLEQAVTLGLIQTNPCAKIRNRRVKLDEDTEIRPFETWEEIEAISAELNPTYRAIPAMLVGTGMRPEELFGLDRRDVDRERGVLQIERVYTRGREKPCMKSDRQRRRVPLRAKVLEVLDSVPTRIDTPVLFPAGDGGRIKLDTFRQRHWTPALRAAGIDHRRVYDCRHTFASWSIRAGVQLFYLSRIMGTSVAQIDATYGHLVQDSDEYLRGLLDTYDAESVSVTEGSSPLSVT
ncbi:MAG: site-specific integrase [Gaiellaceae bacterium]